MGTWMSRGQEIDCCYKLRNIVMMVNWFYYRNASPNIKIRTDKVRIAFTIYGTVLLQGWMGKKRKV